MEKLKTYLEKHPHASIVSYLQNEGKPTLFSMASYLQVHSHSAKQARLNAEWVAQQPTKQTFKQKLMDIVFSFYPFI